MTKYFYQQITKLAKAYSYDNCANTSTICA